MRQTPDPAAPTIEAIDRRLADVRRKIANKRKYAKDVDDDREREEVAAEVKLLRQQERSLEAERAATFAHFADWHATQEGLEHILDWCERVSGNLDRFTFEERHQTLLALKVEIALYKTDHTPRVDGLLQLPLSGLVPLGTSDDDGVMVRSTSRQ
jgi:hypothetical protein